MCLARSPCQRVCCPTGHRQAEHRTRLGAPKPGAAPPGEKRARKGSDRNRTRQLSLPSPGHLRGLPRRRRSRSAQMRQRAACGPSPCAAAAYDLPPHRGATARFAPKSWLSAIRRRRRGGRQRLRQAGEAAVAVLGQRAVLAVR
eukprot:6213799-Pleurochrysis_carterae.AAC.11